MDTILQDLRYALRAFANRPGFTSLAILTLALGIGPTTAVYSVVEGVLLRPLPYRDAGRVVRVGGPSSNTINPANSARRRPWRRSERGASRTAPSKTYHRTGAMVPCSPGLETRRGSVPTPSSRISFPCSACNRYSAAASPTRRSPGQHARGRAQLPLLGRALRARSQVLGRLHHSGWYGPANRGRNARRPLVPGPAARVPLGGHGRLALHGCDSPAFDPAGTAELVDGFVQA